MNARPPSARTRLLLATSGILLSLVFAELILRGIGFPMPRLLTDQGRRHDFTTPHAQFLYEGYLAGTFVDFSNTVTLNGEGFHDVPHAPARARPETHRTFVLGDSYVAALSIPQDLTFPRQLEARLRHADPLGHGDYEVIAIGHGNRAQLAQLHWLQRYGPIYKPDLVLLAFFCGNDFMENAPAIFARASAFARFYQDVVAPRKTAFFDRALLLPRSRLNGVLAEALTTWYAAHLDLFDHAIQADDLVSPELGVYHTPASPEWETARQETAALLDAIRDECARQGTSFAIAVLVGPQAIGEVGEHAWLKAKSKGLDLGQPQRWVNEWCASRQVPVLNLAPALESAGIRRVFWRHDGHLTPVGNTIVADALGPFVAQVIQAATNAPASRLSATARERPL